ncbi:MAG: homoserine kinase [Verrucomicrobia bacterium]|nr:homoserine kinase [Verrucomicrobiota bacterium]
MKSPHLHLPFWIRVPATTANLGPGFDALALALGLYNYIAIEPGSPERPDPFAQEILEAYHKARNLPLKPYKLIVRGNVPPARGLGSSATIRLGMLAALDKVNKKPLDLDWLIETATRLEGHPDNVTAAALGGFVVCGGAQPARARVSSRLKFVAAVPRIETSTRTARSILPPSVSLQDAVNNLRNSARITAAFLERKYEDARGAFHDRLHQPHRAALVPGLEQAIEAAERAGAIGAFLSGAGPTILAICQKSEKSIGHAMVAALQKAGLAEVDIRVLSADNGGLTVARFLPPSARESRC